jgi:hypothetical protein
LARVRSYAELGAVPNGAEAAVRHDAVTWLDFRADDLARARDFIRSLLNQPERKEKSLLGSWEE